MPMLQPPVLRAGDTVMLVSPSGPPDAERVARGTDLLAGWGLAAVDDRAPQASADSLRDALMTAEPVVVAADPAAETGPVSVGGPVVTGTLLGGNLCLLTSTIGTRDLPDLRGAILLLEEVE